MRKKKAMWHSKRYAEQPLKNTYKIVQTFFLKSRQAKYIICTYPYQKNKNKMTLLWRLYNNCGTAWSPFVRTRKTHLIGSTVVCSLTFGLAIITFLCVVVPVVSSGTDSTDAGLVVVISNSADAGLVVVMSTSADVGLAVVMSKSVEAGLVVIMSISIDVGLVVVMSISIDMGSVVIMSVSTDAGLTVVMSNSADVGLAITMSKLAVKQQRAMMVNVHVFAKNIFTNEIEKKEK